MSKTRKLQNRIMLAVLCLLVVIFITPILFIIMNSFKGKLYISDNPFNWPSGDMFAGLENYTEGIRKTGCIWLVCIHYRRFCSGNRTFYLHDRMVYHKSQNQTEQYVILSVCILYGSSVPDGYVYHVQAG